MAGLICAGRKSILSSVEEQLLQWFFELREQGIGISVPVFLPWVQEQL